MNFYTKRNNTDFYTVYYKYLKKSKQKQKTKLKKSYETPELKRGSCPYCHGTDHQRITSKDCLYYGIPLQQVKAIIKDNKTNANKRIREIEIDNDMNLTSSAKRSKHTSPTIQTLLSPNLQPQIQTQSILTQPSTPVSTNSTESEIGAELLKKILKVNPTYRDENLNFPCQCGSTTHARTNKSVCILNEKNKNLNLITDVERDHLSALHKQRKIDKREENQNQYVFNYRIYRSNNSEHLLLKRKSNKLINKQNQETQNHKYFEIAKSPNFSTSNIFGEHVELDKTKPNFARHVFPERNCFCPYCDALVWPEERSGGTKLKPLYSICCAQGKVNLPPISPIPESLWKHLASSHFCTNSRKYNASFSLVSMNANNDKNLSVNNVYTYRVQGQIHHRIGPILPNPGQNAVHAQIYFKDGEDEQAKLRQDYSTNLDFAVLKQLQWILHDCNNPFVKEFQKAATLYKKNPSCEFNITLKPNKSADKRVYNEPSAQEVAVLIPNFGESDQPTQREFVVFEKTGGLKIFDTNNMMYDPLMYPLMFPFGDLGWSPNSIPLRSVAKEKDSEITTDASNEIENDQDSDENHDSRNFQEQEQTSEEQVQMPIQDEETNKNKKKMSFVSAMQYYSYQLCDRAGNPLHYFGRLWQQYIVDQYSKIELGRLNFFRFNQDKIRADLYQNVQNTSSNESGKSIGQRIILPSTYKGSPRNLTQLYQDAMSIIRAKGKPDLFITITCNPKWPEITNELKGVIDNSQKLTIIARVFNLKLKAILNDIIKLKIFGHVEAYMYTIEFQKRGLPHAHCLFILEHNCKPKTNQEIDNTISAEIPDPVLHPELYATITKTMVHGPCGALNPNAPCMVDGVCSKLYPKNICEETKENDDGYPEYRRRINMHTCQVKVKMKQKDPNKKYNYNLITVDNSWIVPYNPYLSLKYNCHINAEVCSSVQAVKYIFKYIYKGPDKAQTVFQPIAPPVDQTKDVDEITEFVDARYISAIEGCWHIFHFAMHDKSPSVMRLDMHNENQNTVVFKDNEKVDKIKQRSTKLTKLTAWFQLNQTDEFANKLLYHDIPKHYVWKADKCIWSRRKFEKTSDMIGRLYYISPSEIEKFSLRLLLLNVPGAKSFDDLRTYGVTANGEPLIHKTCELCCLARGLLTDDSVWNDVLTEASHHTSDIRQLRQLFVTILQFNRPVNPGELWEKHKKTLTNDILYEQKIRTKNHNLKYNQHMYDTALYCINELLYQYGKSIGHFRGLPELPPDFRPIFADQNQFNSNRYIRNELDYDKEHLKIYAEACYKQLNTNQKIIYDKIINNNAGVLPRGRLYFVDGPGGTGKTFLYNAILAKKRSEGKIVLAVATSGIAANLLDGGKTAHSVLRIPIVIYNDSCCRIPVNSDLADMLRICDCIIWDEAVMAHKNVFLAVQRTLQDILALNDESLRKIPFGNMQMLFGGDFRQILPVVKRGNRSQIVEASIKRAPFWKYVEELRLTENMRIQKAAHNDGVDQANLNSFSEFLLSVGEGRYKYSKTGVYIDEVVLPDNIAQNMDEMELISKVYPDIYTNYLNPVYMCNRAILAARNSIVNTINELAIDYFPGISRTFLSTDSCIDENQNQIYLTEFLNQITDPSLPLHKLTLKLYQPIILIRNISQADGLNNGTRVTVMAMNDHFLDVQIPTGKNKGKRFLIPRLAITPSDSQLPITLKRVQFPVKSAFSMSINKSQGATLEKVGIFLNEPVFTHGQLYVALSRVSSLNDIIIATNHTIPGTTRNVVYEEVLKKTPKEL